MIGVRASRRRRALLTALVLVAGALAWSIPAHAAEDSDPLEVRLTTLTPSSIPRQGPIVITGEVSNPTDEVWELVRVYPVFSSEPMTTPEEVALAASSDPATTASGSRLTGEGQFTEIARLAPRQSATFRLRIPRRDLPISGAAGVYWVGAQALGTNAQGRDLLADGRARSFMPLVPPKKTAQMSLIAPLRGPVERDVRTRIADPVGLAELFGPSGRLGRLVGTLNDDAEITWLVDPALLDAAADLGDDNPPLSLGPPPTTNQDEPTASPTAEPTPGPSSGQGAPAPVLDEAARRNATSWLATVTTTLAQADVLALPYADVDAFAALRRRPSLLAAAQDMATTRLSDRGITSKPAVAPPDRHVDDRLLSAAPRTFDAVAHTVVRPSPATASLGEHRVLLSQPAAADGGPGPTRALGALNLRQRILAEAALHALTGTDDPMVVGLPDAWDPGPSWRQADFLDGLDTDWLDLVRTPSAITGEVTELPYSASDRRAELDEDLLTAVDRLTESGATLGSLLDTENNVQRRLRAMAFAGASYAAREDQASAMSLVSTMSDVVAGLTDRVSVLGTEFVTLSGGSGTITVALDNGLKQPVRIGLEISARRKDQLAFEEIEPFTLQPDQRTTVRLQVSTTRLGVNEVTIHPTTASGERVGTPLTVTIRSSEVGRWFWSVMIGAGCVLVVMLAKRVRDRIRNRRWRPVETDETAPDTDRDTELDTGAVHPEGAQHGPTDDRPGREPR